MKLDLKIINGIVVDGTGNGRFRADVGIADHRVVALGRLEHLDAQETYDAANRIVAPGFIDTHGHDDLMAKENPDMLWKTSQGVTTVVVGNCGVSAAPAPLKGNTAEVFSLLGDSPLHATVAGYLADLEKNQPMINIAALVGHGNLRLAAMRDPLADPTDAELQAMQALLAQSLQDGAVGFSTGLVYMPGKMAKPPELGALARVAKDYGAVHTSHIRNEADQVEEAVDEVLALARATGCNTVLSHHKCMMPHNWGRSEFTLRNIDGAKNEGLDVALDMYPYAAGSTILIPARADQIDKILITSSEPHPECQGQYLSDIAQAWQCSKKEAAERLCPGGAIYFAMDEDEVERIYSHSSCMVGSDGLPNDKHPHPRLWGTFTRVLGRFVREKKLVALEEAIRKMTSLPASVYGLQGRGLIQIGYAADIVIFDEATVLDKASWESPTLPSQGIEAVFVNGVKVFPCLTAVNRPGRVLRRGG